MIMVMVKKTRRSVSLVNAILLRRKFAGAALGLVIRVYRFHGACLLMSTG